MTSVLTVDDESLVRSAIRAMLQSSECVDLCVVGDCSGREAVRFARESGADVVLLDLRMPDVDGLTVLRGIKRLAEPPAVVMMTRFATDSDVLRAFGEGAIGYLLKDATATELATSVREAAAGFGAVSRLVAPTVIDGYRRFASVSVRDAEARNRAEQFTQREREVLELLGSGLTNREIADCLVLSPETVKSHVSAVLAKLGTKNRVRAALAAERLGLLDKSA
ncbi:MULTISPECIES: response regulator transcription factor [unclassified Streptomyces]|jgi:DNA-binding NarL/FixJ family response regulator|uniref:response regulator n=1 Tax=unclassified Streptomyces TaxID=2593676 RepID=UPI000FFF2001|nr:MULTISPECIES: response regulator transcription factor [unclassified Streptomyces]